MQFFNAVIERPFRIAIVFFIVSIFSAGARAIDTLPASPTGSGSNYAFYYGNQLPIAELQAFDKVVADPDSDLTPGEAKTPNTQWLAYVSVGEVAPSRGYAKMIPQEWLIGHNNAWQSKLIDQAAPGWPDFFVKNVIAPLWGRGYRGFFLDTLDSYQLAATTPQAQAQQQAGLVAVIKAIKTSYPDASLVLNRGFEILPQISGLVSAVALESLYRGWDQSGKRYTQVPENDRQWLLGQIKTIRENYRLPVISIDYCPPEDKACAEDAASKIEQLGVTPYITDGALSTVGRGRIAVVPRRILIVQNRAADINIDISNGLRYVAMPLNYLGYKVEYADIKDELPKNISSDIYAGVVVWYSESMGRGETPKFVAWLRERMKSGLRVAFMNQFGAPVESSLGQLLGLKPVAGRPQGVLRIESKDPMIGFESMPPNGHREAIGVLAGAGSSSLLRLRAGAYAVDAAAITPWGGFVLAPYAVYSMDDIQKASWSIQPLSFLRRALNLTLIPVPDTTTESGRRLLMAHVDGDGFASRNEYLGGGFPGDSLMKNIWEKYKIPTALSVIEGEVGVTGMYPKLSAELESIARRMFALPYVEVGSHTYSHPFDWDEVVRYQKISQGKLAGTLQESFHLNIPDYKFNLDREIAGTINYIDDKLTTPAKPVTILLWPGNCQPPAEAIKKAFAAGVLNLNGGDTLITRSNPSWTAISPLGANKGGGAYQIFAPNQNEDIYTNNWTGPFYGFERVIETFQMTDTPYRFKPVDIYYHMYSGTKTAALKALTKVYDYAVSQPYFPVYPTEYARKVLDFENMSVARQGDVWIVRSNGDLRTIRLAPDLVPQLEGAHGVAGYAPGPAATYVHLAGSSARFSVTKGKNVGPYLADGNGRISNLERNANSLSFDFKSHVHPIVRVAQATRCSAGVNGKPARLIEEGAVSRIDMQAAADALNHIEIRCAN